MRIYINSPIRLADTRVKQITILASPSELRRIGQFMARAADFLEKHDKDYGHEHLQDFERGSNSKYPDIIIGQALMPATVKR